MLSFLLLNDCSGMAFPQSAWIDDPVCDTALRIDRLRRHRLSLIKRDIVNQARRKRYTALHVNTLGRAVVDVLAGRAGALPQLLVVAGDVNSGSSVECEGDICVLGRLSGKAHAGSKGDRKAVIRAQQIDSDQIEIAGVCTGQRLQLNQATLVICNTSGSLELRPQQEAGVAVNPATFESPDLVEEVESPTSAAVLPVEVQPEACPDEDFIAEVRKGAPLRKKKRQGGLKKGQSKLRQLTLEALRECSPPARASLVTGAYIMVVGVALILAPLKTFTLLFDQSLLPLRLALDKSNKCENDQEIPLLASAETEQNGSVAPVWIRVGGTLCCLFGCYYLGAAHGDITRRGVESFYQSTVLGRLFLCFVFAALVVLRKSQWQLMILAAVNLAGAVAMHRALATRDQAWDLQGFLDRLKPVRLPWGPA